MIERADVVVIGAGVVGLAIARAFALAGREVIVLEKNAAIGEETSSRNSEVIHAGIPYRPGGMRARLTVKGRDALYHYCKSRGVDHVRCEKLIVAYGEDQVARLRPLKTTAEKNGVNDLKIISGKEAAALETHLECDAAMLSPSTGIIDSHGLMLALLGDFENAGGVLALKSLVKRGEVNGEGVLLTIQSPDEVTLHVKLVVNCAGLWSDRVARSIAGIPPNSIPPIFYGKGQYFSYSGKAPFNRLIYPMPAPDSLGVHYTRDLGAQAKLGPDIAFINVNDDFEVDETRREAFAAAARRYWPDIDVEKLNPGYAGIRPKIADAGEEGDFLICGAETHGVASYVGLYGIESPGLTTCLSIAEHVVQLAQ